MLNQFVDNNLIDMHSTRSIVKSLLTLLRSSNFLNTSFPPPPIPPPVLMNFVVFPPVCGDSVADL